MAYCRPKPTVSLSSPLPQLPTPNTPPAFKSKSKSKPQLSADSPTLDFSIATAPLPSRHKTNPMLKWDIPEVEQDIPELEPPAPIASSKRPPPHAETMRSVAPQGNPLDSPGSALGTGEYDVPLNDDDDEDAHNEVLEEDDDSVESFFYTPHNKLVKPLQTAFMSTGLLSKRNRQRANISAAAHAPETPCKRLTTHFVVPQAPLLPTSTIDMPPTPTRSTPFTTNTQIRSRKQKGVFTDSPIKLKRPNLTLRGDLVTQAKLAVASTSGPTTPISTDAESPLGMFSRSNSGYFRTPVPPLLRKRSSIMDTSDDWIDSPMASISSSSEDQLTSPTAPPGMIDFLQAAGGSDDKDGAALESSNGKKRRIALMGQLTQINPPKTPKTPKTPRPPVNPTVSRLYTAWANFLTKEYLEELRDGDFEADHPTPSRPPEQIDVDYFGTQFTILAELGNGEFSVAYRVMDKMTGRVSAVKKTKEPFAGWHDRMDRLEEVKHMWTIGQHPHCVELINAWEQEGHLYIQEELCAWGSLDTFAEEYSQRDRLEEARIWRMLAELALGLKHIHDSKVLHLDLKPANVFITEIGSLKIGDFGMAAAWPVGKGVDREGDRQYMGPEVLSGNLDKPADIFSLGLTIFEIATNVVLPDNGPQWQKLREGDISATNLDSLSDELVDLIRSMLHPDPKKRPTVDGVLADSMVARAVEAKSDDGLGALDGLVEIDGLVEADDQLEVEGEDDGNTEGDIVEEEEENGTQCTPPI